MIEANAIEIYNQIPSRKKPNMAYCLYWNIIQLEKSFSRESRIESGWLEMKKKWLNETKK
jgi:hypothetical protein